MPFEVEDLTKALGRMPGDNQNSEPYAKVVTIDFSLTSAEAETLRSHTQKRLDQSEKALASLVMERATGMAPGHHKYDQTLNKKLAGMYLLSLLEANGVNDSHRGEVTIAGEIPRQVASVLRKEINRFGESIDGQYEVVEWGGAPVNNIGSALEEYARIATRVGAEPDFAEALDVESDEATVV